MSLAFPAVLAAACTVEEAAPVDPTGDPDPVPAPECTADEDCGMMEACIEEVCEPVVAAPLGGPDGPAGITFVYAPPYPREATDVAFDPSVEGRVWLLQREYESSEPCDSQQTTAEGCGALEGTTVIIDDPATENAELMEIKDPNAWHFMRRPTGIAMGAGETFATCGEARTGNFLDDLSNFMGPSLWSSNLEVYGVQPPGLNGSHLDMLHGTPFCMGIAWERDNVYWLFNGDVGAIDRVDFKADHGPGESYHDDGEYRRYAMGQFLRVPNVPSHMQMGPEGRWLYVADTGNGRVVRLDTTSGTDTDQDIQVYEDLALHVMVDGAVVEEVIAPGTLQQPSGLVIADGTLYVSDYATSIIHAFDLATAEPLADLQLEVPGVTGLTFDPEGRLWFAEKDAGNVFRIEP